MTPTFFTNRIPHGNAGTTLKRFGAAAIVAATGFAIAAAGPAKMALAEAGAFSGQQKGEIEKIVREYLLNNPELFLEVQVRLEKKLQERQEQRLKQAITENAQTLFRRAGAPIAGNPKGDVTVVEFFDYNCGFCKRGFQDVAKLIEKDKNVKVVLKEFPIFGKGSEDAARVALAAKEQGKYWDVHQALLSLDSRVDGKAALRAAEKLGLDMGKLKSDMTSKAVNEEIKTVRDLAQSLGINGTPHFLVGDRTIAGAPEDLLQQFQNNVSEIRKSGGCKVC